MYDKKENTAKVFLSYHTSKAELVEHVSKYLQKNEINTWYAPKNIHAGERWDEAIHNAIKDCKAFVLLFCGQADSSPQVKNELSLANKYNKAVFWLRVERVEPNYLSYFLTPIQWIDWLDMRDSTLEKLIGDIGSINEINAALTSEDENFVMQNIIENSNQSEWVKGVIAFDSNQDAAECAARVYFSLAQRYPDSSVVLPTGRSGTILFRAMERIAQDYTGCPFGDAHLISDTETFGVSGDHETSRTNHIREMLINPLKRIEKAPTNEQICLLSGVYADIDPVKKAQKTIRTFPPIVHAISISPVGEIIAYEVGTYNEIHEIIDDPPRIVEIGEHSKKYIDPNQPSKSIISIGLGTVLSTSVLLILALDLQKANILHRLFNGPMTAGIPATLLRKHPNAFILTTTSVAKEAEIDEMVIYKKNAKEAAEWIIST